MLRRLKTSLKKPKWKAIVGYVAFGIFALAMGIFATFPYNALQKRIANEAEANGFHVSFDSLGPGFGIKAKNVRISRQTTGDDDKPNEPIVLKRVWLRPSIIPLGVAIVADAFDGSVKINLGLLGSSAIRVDLSDLDLSGGNLKAFSGVDLSGKISGQLSLDIPNVSSRAGKKPESDLSQASGALKLQLSGVAINGGTVRLAIPMYGSDPTPIDLPKVAVGDFEGKLKFEKGAGSIEKLTIKGQGLDVTASGTIKLAKRLDYAEPNIEMRLKTEPEFVKSLGVYGVALSQLHSDPKDPSWRVGRLTGYLGRPSLR